MSIGGGCVCLCDEIVKRRLIETQTDCDVIIPQARQTKQTKGARAQLLPDDVADFGRPPPLVRNGSDGAEARGRYGGSLNGCH